jgi:hypothetical protein
LSEEGKLLIKPLRELKKLRSDEKTLKDITVKSDTTHMLEGISGDAMELEIVIEAPAAEEFGIKVLCDQDGKQGFYHLIGQGQQDLKGRLLQPPFELEEGEDLTLRIFIDKSMIEVFANDRQAAVAWHEYDPKDLHVSLFSKGGDLKVNKVSAWQMKSIYPKAATELKETHNEHNKENAWNPSPYPAHLRVQREEPKTIIETPTIPKSLPKTWLTYHLAHPRVLKTPPRRSQSSLLLEGALPPALHLQAPYWFCLRPCFQRRHGTLAMAPHCAGTYNHGARYVQWHGFYHQRRPASHGLSWSEIQSELDFLRPRRQPGSVD